MEKFSDNIKKVILAGIGAVAVTAEKSKDLLDEMVEKGELTVEQGKVPNEELRHKEDYSVFASSLLFILLLYLLSFNYTPVPLYVFDI